MISLLRIPKKDGTLKQLYVKTTPLAYTTRLTKLTRSHLFHFRGVYQYRLNLVYTTRVYFFFFLFPWVVSFVKHYLTYLAMQIWLLPFSLFFFIKIFSAFLYDFLKSCYNLYSFNCFFLSDGNWNQQVIYNTFSFVHMNHVSFWFGLIKSTVLKLNLVISSL